jgi:hypothetical protein
MCLFFFFFLPNVDFGASYPDMRRFSVWIPYSYGEKGDWRGRSDVPARGSVWRARFFSLLGSLVSSVTFPSESGPPGMPSWCTTKSSSESLVDGLTAEARRSPCVLKTFKRDRWPISTGSEEPCGNGGRSGASAASSVAAWEAMAWRINREAADLSIRMLAGKYGGGRSSSEWMDRGRRKVHPRAFCPSACLILAK